MDVVYVIDGSSSVPVDVFNDMVKYVQNKLITYNISSVSTRIALSTLGSERRYSSIANGGLSEYIEKALKSLEKPGGAGRIDVELRTIAQDIRNGQFRENAGVLVVFLLYGKNDITGAADFGPAARELKGVLFILFDQVGLNVNLFVGVVLLIFISKSFYDLFDKKIVYCLMR